MHAAKEKKTTCVDALLYIHTYRIVYLTLGKLAHGSHSALWKNRALRRNDATTRRAGRQDHTELSHTYMPERYR